MLLKIPYEKQKNEYFCGPATLAMCLKYFGKDISQEELAIIAKTTEKEGTANREMLNAILESGLIGVTKKRARIKNVKNSIRKKRPVIVNYTEPEGGIGHYAIPIGIKNGKIILADPWHGPKFQINQNQFKKLWLNNSKKSPRWMLKVIK
ncbi:MAG: hypothetical protein COU07_01560 [Candidatus Harrisonbacteria bacterium CG10_big_fil_rev_8_21_14_0_10_40_38]|uniref:Peptidase C39 domain-containing protein n=1 Tax=Candidatus Harrisonbacteria bacterium CG10_big_fil_rev_8_21_14_0_10_40_38 TaxID=1974583 RepID=A0A2H0UT39_9BACT|nr:MAG: hypothetical protein COU07_01560 [Candidatus Harrisonbacteria bacterium CG10_big_fil_rev_8_21_14_0_10_40_38]